MDEMEKQLKLHSEQNSNLHPSVEQLKTRLDQMTAKMTDMTLQIEKLTEEQHKTAQISAKITEQLRSVDSSFETLAEQNQAYLSFSCELS